MSDERDYGELKAQIADLMRWRDVFETDIKESLKTLDSKIDREMRDMGAEIRAIRQEISRALHSAINRLPLWAQIVGVAFAVIAGWIVEYAVYAKH